MQISIVRHAESNTQSWGNGAGQMGEIYRLPELNSDKNYLFRFSTATIEVPQSDFTLYPGYIRHHRTLEGLCEFEVAAENNQTIVDHSGTVFDFFGESQLTCKLLTPAAFAINLIHRPQVQVKDRVVQVDANNMPLHELLNVPLHLKTGSNKRYSLIYVINGELGLENVLDAKQYHLSSGDTLVVTSETTGEDRSNWRITGCSAKLFHGSVLV